MMKKQASARILSLLLIALLTCALLLSSCGVADDWDGANGDTYYPEQSDKDDIEENGATGGLGTTVDTPLADRKIIKTVNESIQTAAYDTFLTSMKQAVTEAGGYISSARYSGESYYNQSATRRAELVIRIPAASLDGFVSQIGTLGTVSSYYESVNDVTEIYIDIESRISVLEAEETALLSILEKADDVDTMLSIRSQLLSVQSDLASLRAQKNSYDDKVAYSTVNLSIYEVAREVPVVEDPTFFEEIGADLRENLYGIGQFFRGFFVWLIGSSPVLLLLAACATGVFFLVRHLLRRSKKRLEQRMAARHTADQNSDQNDAPKQ